MKIYIPLFIMEDDYKTLPIDAEIVKIFTFIKGPPNFPHIQAKLQEVLDGADLENDFILFKGPAYLCALAGYVWFTRENRVHANFYSYNKKMRRYEPHTHAIDSEVANVG